MQDSSNFGFPDSPSSPQILMRCCTQSFKIRIKTKGDWAMSTRRTRREVLKGSLALAGWSVLGLPEFVLPALAQGETVVPFTDWPANFNPSPAPDRRTF